MPQYVEKDGRYCISYITGPAHVWLGLRFGRLEEPVRIVQEPPIGVALSEPIDESVLLEAVRAGVAEAAQKMDSALSTVEVSYVANDTPRAALYQYCAYLVATRVLQGGEFGGA